MTWLQSKVVEVAVAVAVAVGVRVAVAVDVSVAVRVAVAVTVGDPAAQMTFVLPKSGMPASQDWKARFAGSHRLVSSKWNTVR